MNVEQADGRTAEVLESCRGQNARLIEENKALRHSLTEKDAELAAERAEVDAEIGRKWHADSSLETWFPYTAEELVRLRAERDALRAEVELWKERAYQLSHA